jgi:hypothetical protein
MAALPGPAAFALRASAPKLVPGSLAVYHFSMCRNIKTLFNFDPPATDDEVRASALQFVRKLSGFTKPSKANEAAFNLAVEEVTEVARRLIDSLSTTAPPKDRDEVAARLKERAAERYS